MRASGLSGRQPPYCLPRAQTPGSAGAPGAAWVPEGASACGALGGRWCRGPGCRSWRWWWAGERGFGGCGCRPRGSGAAWVCGGAGRCAGVPGRVVGCGEAGGATRSRASWAGAWTGRGAALPSGRGARGGEGAAAGPDTGGRWTVTQPVRAATATVTRSVAVVVVRCTRATLLGPGRRRPGDGPRMPRTGDLRPRRGCGRHARVTPPGRVARRTGRSPCARSSGPRSLSPRSPRPGARGAGRRGRCGGRTPRSCGCRSTAG